MVEAACGNIVAPIALTADFVVLASLEKQRREARFGDNHRGWKSAASSSMTICRRRDPRCSRCFANVTDHVRTVQERIDSLREVLAFAFEASLLVGQAQETAVSKKLASWLAIIAVPTAIAGIYGMNFKHMPELEWQYGYFGVISTILLVCTGLFWRFRRVGWL
jgi:Mg2+ and Co2+ transporter CorA